MSQGPVATILSLRAKALSALTSLEPVALLLGRCAVGLLFVSTGWGKVHNLARVTEFFRSLGIPAPGFQAVLVANTELFCGTALVLGLATRLAAIPLSVTMVVALITAKAKDIHGIFDLVAADEFTYLVLLWMIVILGPGRAAIDDLIRKRLEAPRG